MSNVQPAVTVDKLVFGYTQEPVIRGISFQVNEGDFAAIIGSNGSGKSTLLKLLLGQLTPASGQITLLGQNIRSFHDWPKIGYVPQNAATGVSSFPATALEVVRANLYSQIGLFRFPTSKHTQMAKDALAQVGMEGYAKRLIGDLSGGQQQRIQLARVLVAKPQLLLLDEPTTGVDRKSADDLCALLYRLNRQTGITTVMVTHDPERIAPYTPNILCIEHGLLLDHPHGHRHQEG